MPVNAESPEIVAAVQWWTDILRARPPEDDGDADQSALANFVIDNYVPLPSEQQLAVFARALPALIIAQFQDYGGYGYNDWDVAVAEGRPNIGGAFRVLNVDYHPALALAAAAREAGIDALNFPCKTAMWINPGCVKVSCGYRAPAEVIYGEEVRADVPEEGGHDRD